MSIQPIDRLNQFVLDIEEALEPEFTEDVYIAVCAALDKLKGSRQKAMAKIKGGPGAKK